MIWRTFDIVVFNITLGSFGAFVSENRYEGTILIPTTVAKRDFKVRGPLIFSCILVSLCNYGHPKLGRVAGWNYNPLFYRQVGDVLSKGFVARHPGDQRAVTKDKLVYLALAGEAAVPFPTLSTCT